MEKLKLIVAIAGHGLGERMCHALEGASCAACFHPFRPGHGQGRLDGIPGPYGYAPGRFARPCAEGKTKDALAALQAAMGEARYFAVTVPFSSIAGRDTYDLLAKGGNAHG